jgi:hypothetical protein
VIAKPVAKTSLPVPYVGRRAKGNRNSKFFKLVLRSVQKSLVATGEKSVECESSAI